MFQVTILTVDAFTARAFSGNPAAICDLSNDELFLQFEKFNQKHNGNGYQLIAREMNLSETAFLLPYKKQDNIALLSTEKHFSLRWFTPTVEVPLCGHATLATSHYVFQQTNVSLPFYNFTLRLRWRI
jgi:PhzF family phenazine biosynthesis protein